MPNQSSWTFRAIKWVEVAGGTLLCGGLVSIVLTAPAPAAVPSPQARRLTAPLSFEPNQGQTSPGVQFLSRGDGYALALAPGEAVLNLEQRPGAVATDTLRMGLLGANRRAPVKGVARQPGVVSYFIGNDPTRWRRGIPTYSKVQYADVYPGVDLVYYGNQRELEYDFIVAPGADPDQIVWRIEGATASVDGEGNLVLRAAQGPAVFRRPVVYQTDGDRKVQVRGEFTVAGNRVGFRLGRYDHSKSLVIDPVLSYATYLGGSRTDAIGATSGPGIAQVGSTQGLAIDGAGSVYVTGRTYSLDFPIQRPYLGAPPAKMSGVTPGAWPSAFVTKFSADGSTLEYSTYLGGNSSDYAVAIAVDSGGNAYVTGWTSSPDFPVTAGAYQTLCSPLPSNSTPTQSGCSGGYNPSVFVTKLNAAGTALVYSTFLGGYGNAWGQAIAVDGTGQAYVAGNTTEYCSVGYTYAGCFPTTTGAVIAGSRTGGGSPQFAFVAALDASGAKLLYSTLFGDQNGLGTSPASGSGATQATAVAVDSDGYFYLAGETMGARLPTTSGVVQPTAAPLDSRGVYVMAYRGFVAKFSPAAGSAGASLAYATYLGGKTQSMGDYVSGITTDSSGNLYVAGYTNSKDFPVTSGVYGPACLAGTCAAAHVTKLNPTATAILWSTYLGGAKTDGSDSVYWTGPVQLDGAGNAYLIGMVGAGFPMVNAVETPGTGGSQQVLVAELDPTASTLLFSTVIGSHGLNTTSPAGLAVDSLGNIYVAGNTNGPNLITTPGAFQPSSNDGACCQYGNGFVARIASGLLPVDSLSVQGLSAAAGAASGTVQVSAAAGMAWSATSNASWITITDGATGSGGGTVSFSVTANSGAARVGTLTIGGLSFTVEQEAASSAGLAVAGSLAHLASAGGWDSLMVLVNLASTAGEARLNFYANDGSPLWLPSTFPQQSTAGLRLGATFDRTLAANASLLLDSTGDFSSTLLTGWAQLVTSGTMNGFVVFTHTPTGQAASVPLETRNASAYRLAFDNTGTVSTGLAIANQAGSAARVNVVIRNDAGAQIGTGTISLAARGHSSFMLSDASAGFPVTAGLRGTVEFDTPTGGQISVLGLRMNSIPSGSGFALTSLPLLANVGTGGGALAHFASGGGWQTTFTLVNTGTSAATATLNFFGGNGAAAALPLAFPQTGTTTTASTVSQSLAAGASLVVLVRDPGGSAITSGSATLSTTGNVGGFAVFRQNATGQEAAVPMLVDNAASYVLPFDNTGILSTGLALANVAAKAAVVNVILRDDAGAQIGTGTISLPARGHTSFMLTDTASGGWAVTSGVRGTIEFVTPTGGQIAPLGLRVAATSGGYTITTIPVMARN
jgi:hypothetical protein